MAYKLVLLLAAAWLFVMLAHHSDARNNAPKDSTWETYKQFHKKSYRDEHHHKRSKEIFEKRVKHIAEHNKRFANGEVDYELEINHLTDLDEAALSQRKGLKVPDTHSAQGQSSQEATVPPTPRRTKRALPASFDWRNYGAVTAVKDQGQCGSCWSFSATGALEGQTFRKMGQLYTMSEQQIVDCDTVDGACNGGWPVRAFNYIKTGGGLVVESAYPYVSGTTETRGTCNQPNPQKVWMRTISSWVTLPQNETAIMEALYNVGPLSMVFDASNIGSYSSGIYNCPTNYQLDHAVLLVGYGADSTGKPYWIVKNQWGTNWGMNGYFYLARGTNACGVATNTAYPVL